ncbi:CvpA family protein [uncultured Chitinophaga sp.]|uniref:CvpA family protein n=1 Tax=uncultured Chitinophaga sp. TaxID=339340 RepID=UPI0025D1CF55|nr:CvpA family protein [uncultured Chitinophaga sp.]
MAIDIIFAIILVFAIYRGFTRGLIVAVFSFVACMIGMAAALKLSSTLSVYLQEHANIHTRWLPVISFVLLFVGVVLLIRLGANLLEKMVELVLLGWVNKLGGILLYTTIFIIIYSVMLWIANQLYWLSPETKLQSVVYPYIEGIGPWVVEHIGRVLPFFRGIFSDLEAFFETAASQTSA